MSLDTIAVFDRTIAEATPASLLARLSADAAFAPDLIAYWRPRWQPQAWELDLRPSRTHPALVGPGGFALDWHSHTLQLYHMMPFRVFASDAWHRQALQRACRHLATLVGSSQVLYTHELMPNHGDTLPAIAHWLTRTIGPPAVDVAALADAEPFGPRAWYLETVPAAGSVSRPVGHDHGSITGSTAASGNAMASTEWYPPGAAAALARVRTTIERERRFGRVTCVLEPYHLDATLAPPEAANAIVTRLGFAPLRDPWRAIDRAHAIAILERILQRDLVDGGEIMPPARALALAVRFVTMFGPTAHLFTNGTFRGAPERSGGRGLEMDTGTPLTDASLDTGVVCFDTQHIGIVWVVDHD